MDLNNSKNLVNYRDNPQKQIRQVRVLTGLRSLQLLLEFLLLLFKGLDLLLQKISFSIMLMVCFIKLIPHIEKLIPTFGNKSIFLSEKFLVVHRLVQSMGFQKGTVGKILHQEVCTELLDIRKVLDKMQNLLA
jgi:hypothetical protein